MKIAKIVAGIVVAVLVVVLVIFLATFDIGKYKGTIQDQAKAATGRNVQIGDIKMSFSLTPAVTLSATWWLPMRPGAHVRRCSFSRRWKPTSN